VGKNKANRFGKQFPKPLSAAQAPKKDSKHTLSACVHLYYAELLAGF